MRNPGSRDECSQVEPAGSSERNIKGPPPKPGRGPLQKRGRGGRKERGGLKGGILKIKEGAGGKQGFALASLPSDSAPRIALSRQARAQLRAIA